VTTNLEIPFRILASHQDKLEKDKHVMLSP